MSLKFVEYFARHSGQAGDSFGLRLIRLWRKREPESSKYKNKSGFAFAGMTKRATAFLKELWFQDTRRT